MRPVAVIHGSNAVAPLKSEHQGLQSGVMIVIHGSNAVAPLKFCVVGGHVAVDLVVIHGSNAVAPLKWSPRTACG